MDYEAGIGLEIHVQLTPEKLRRVLISKGLRPLPQIMLPSPAQ